MYSYCSSKPHLTGSGDDPSIIPQGSAAHAWLFHLCLIKNPPHYSQPWRTPMHSWSLTGGWLAPGASLNSLPHLPWGWTHLSSVYGLLYSMTGPWKVPCAGLCELWGDRAYTSVYSGIPVMSTQSAFESNDQMTGWMNKLHNWPCIAGKSPPFMCTVRVWGQSLSSQASAPMHHGSASSPLTTERNNCDWTNDSHLPKHEKNRNTRAINSLPYGICWLFFLSLLLKTPELCYHLSYAQVFRGKRVGLLILYYV